MSIKNKMLASLAMMMAASEISGANTPDMFEFSPRKSFKPQKKLGGKPVPPRTEPKIGRNFICPKCDSGKKYKNCCLRNETK
jgi:hypothetical protein